MIIELVTFVTMIGTGSLVWFMLQYILEQVVNFVLTEYTQWFSNAFITFIIGTFQWGLLLLCWMPAVIYLWTNTQRPEIRR